MGFDRVVLSRKDGARLVWDRSVSGASWVQVHASSVGKKGMEFSGLLLLCSSHFFTNVGQFRFQLVWSSVLHDMHLFDCLLSQSLVLCSFPQVPHVSWLLLHSAVR